MKNLQKICNLFVIFLASVMILIPAVLTNLKPDQISLTEKRKLAELSPISEGTSEFMTSLNNFLNDRIGLREKMVKTYNEIKVNFFHSRNELTILGKDGWLFFTADLADYTGRNNDPETLEKCIRILKALDNWCSTNGSQFIFMIGPNKATIYSQYMPEDINAAETTFLDALTIRLNEEEILYVNPKDKLIADSDKQELYSKLDTHWNAYGSKYALDELTEKLHLPTYHIPTTEYSEESGDLLSHLAVDSIGSSSVFVNVTPNPDCEIELIPDTDHVILHNEGAPTFTCYRDSFTIALLDYYTYYFDGTVYWDYNILQSQTEFPEYIIFECVERNIATALENCSDILNTPYAE